MSNPNKEPDTSAGRLLKVLREARAVDQNQAAMTMWCQVFGIERRSNTTTTATTVATDATVLIQAAVSVPNVRVATTA